MLVVNCVAFVPGKKRKSDKVCLHHFKASNQSLDEISLDFSNIFRAMKVYAKMFIKTSQEYGHMTPRGQTSGKQTLVADHTRFCLFVHFEDKRPPCSFKISVFFYEPNCI